MSNILIVGTNQDIGYYMAIRLLENENKVTVLDIQYDYISALKESYPDLLHMIRADETDETSFSNGIKKVIKEILNCRYSNPQCVPLRFLQ